MKTVMLSVNPGWIQKIFDGKKKIEVRKTAPKEVPFKALIYCTKGGNLALYKNPNDGEFFLDKHGWRGGEYEDRYLSGKVVGEFVCDRVDEFWSWLDDKGFGYTRTAFYKKTRVPYDDLKKYIGYGRKRFYGWHISNLKIYDKPKELSEFCVTRKCTSCKSGYESSACAYEGKCVVSIPLKRPPQSWCRVEEKE